MNKLNILLVGLVAFVAVAQFVRADDGELVSEIDDDVEVSPDLEGGFMSNWNSHESKSRFGIKHNAESEYGKDIQLNGQTKLVEDRSSPCSYAESEAQCKNCCKTVEAGANGRFTAKVAHLTNRLPGKTKKETCVCYSKDTSYFNPGLAR